MRLEKQGWVFMDSAWSAKPSWGHTRWVTRWVIWETLVKRSRTAAGENGQVYYIVISLLYRRQSCWAVREGRMEFLTCNLPAPLTHRLLYKNQQQTFTTSHNMGIARIFHWGSYIWCYGECSVLSAKCAVHP